MVCKLTTVASVTSTVIHALTVATGRDDLTKDTSFSDPPPDGLGLNDYALQMAFFPVEDAVEAQGCTLKKLTPQRFSSAATIADAVKLVAGDLGVK